MIEQTKQTPLYAWHQTHAAKMAEFAGYDMPTWYSSAKNEHLAVLKGAGLFDTSHMAVVTVSGKDSFDLLQFTFTNDLAGCIGARKLPLVPGRCVYGAFLNDSGGVVDDAIIFQLALDDYMVVVNAGMGAVLATHLGNHRLGRDVAIDDLTDRVGKIDIQGPAAVPILQAVLTEPEMVFDRLPYFAFKGGPGGVKFNNGLAAMISRTGYTGEVGFEIFCSPWDMGALWDLLLATGAPRGLRPCGLAARDSLRAGAVLPLSQQDIGPWPFLNHPWPFALPWDSNHKAFTKNFIGAEALRNCPKPSYTFPFAGFDLRKVSVADIPTVKDTEGKPMGNVLTCITDMGIGRHQGKIFSVASPDKPTEMKVKGLCCGFIIVNDPLEYGQLVFLEDKRRTIKVEIVKDVRPDRTARKPLAHFL